jgi:hypothetical protein
MGDLKPGQKFPTPTPGFGDRVFYETLLRQKPESAMAQEWYVHLPLYFWLYFSFTTFSFSFHQFLHFLSCHLIELNALFRCVNYGVLPHNEAEKLYKIVTERKRSARLGTTSSSPSPQKVMLKKKKVKILKEEAYDDPDVVVSKGGDGIGTATL